MPGDGCPSFLRAVWNSLECKRAQGDISTSWIVTPRLYSLWALTSRVSTELFADCFNESGVLSAYCSIDVNDAAFSALGRWEDHESLIQGGAGNPPFDVQLISSIVRRFEMGVKRSSPYCRLVILPLGKRYKLTSHINSLTSEGELLVSARPGSFPFMNEQVLLSKEHHKPKPSKYQSLGIFVWCNREYLLEYSPPVDIEKLYQVCIDATLYTPEDVILHNDAFLRAFPLELRSSESMIATKQMQRGELVLIPPVSKQS
ncbi:hypothetical protein BWQ96_05590 [Gracilariopsis chorda]|uniref:Uncharacterized protein n=1 Tax=Gracilariopsis chorda TaxID=448386 RepID=A0A2V3IRA6_9FLOR|nr:hypothetical protein BWQ96_05590 [Gracilariopsis chorda]|eukprot:PXF44648.1 hypothetical protein BWQ96_05590 [Gracilariopsis chorda]